MVTTFSSSCDGIMPQVLCFGDVILNINVDGASVVCIAIGIVFSAASRKFLKRLLKRLK